MKKKLQRGKPLEELVKGSMDYTMRLIGDAFRSQFPYMDGGVNYWIVETFAEYVIVNSYTSSTASDALKVDEYWMVKYSRNGDVFTFTPKDQWEVVELAYQPQTKPMVEKKRKDGKRFEERAGAVELTEAVEGSPRRIKVDDVIVAGVVNGNQRRYPSSVIEAAVNELRSHLNESAGSGRVVQVLGEAEHPSDKNGRSNLLETVVRWDEVSFDGRAVSLGGTILGTSKGKDILALMEGGVRPGVSLRGYGESKIVKESGKKIEEVIDLHLTGFDLVLEPSFPTEAMLESKNHQSSSEEEMDPEFVTKLEEAARKEAELTRQLEEARKAQVELDEMKRKTAIEAAIAEATKDLPFGEFNAAFVESMKEQTFENAEAVKKFAESQRKLFAKLAAQAAMQRKGFDEKRITDVAPVLEEQTGTPEFARASFELTESVRRSEMRQPKDLRKNESRAAVWTLQLLERFDKLYQRQLMSESKMFSEAEAASDLNLPYSVSRAIIAEAYPNLVSPNVFDVGLMNGSPENIWFEAFAGETGYTVAITDEVEAGGAEGTWYDLSHANLVPGTVVVTSNPAGTTWVEGTDFIIDYELGKIKFLSAGGINTDDVLVDYSYNAIREGEGAEIQRAKTTMSYQTITAAAMRVADQINHEAIVFSRSQLGWDAVGRTMANIIRQVRLNIDRNLIEKAVAASLSVASNSGGTWISATDPWSLFAEYLGYAKVKVTNRYYEPTGILMSVTNADQLSNWDGFTRLGFPNALLDAAGFAGSVKGLPVFASTQMRDNWALVLNRGVVMHRVYQPIIVKGPFPTYSANQKLIAADQYYAEEYNGSLAPVANKAAHVVIA